MPSLASCDGGLLYLKTRKGLFVIFNGMKLKRGWRATKMWLVGLLLFGVCFGLFVAKYGIRINYWWAASVPLLVLIVRKRKAPALMAIFVIGALIGIFKGQLFYQKMVRYEQLYGSVVTVSGPIADDIGYDEKKQTEFHISPVTIDGTRLPGRVRIRGFGASSVGRGDVVSVTGKLNRTLGNSRQGSVSFAEINVISKNTSWVEKMRGRFIASVYSSLPEPQGSLGLGYLMGIRSALPEDFALALSVVGLTHIVAVSGYNLTILVQFVKKIFEKYSAYQTVFFSLLFIAGFLVITGWSPSIMRASIIAFFSLLAWYYGRTFNPLVLILLGAAITGFMNPLYIWGDVGWYLSFLAFAGVLILAPLIIHTYFKGEKPFFLLAVLIETLAAQAFALPFIAVIFGEVSLISPLANVLVVPLIPFAMLMIFIVGVVGMVSPVVALWLALPVRALMTVTVWVVERLSTIPWAQTSVKLQPWHAGCIYGLLGCFLLWMWLKSRAGRKTARIEAESVDWNLL